jgi:hypothetical protein
MRLAVMCFLGLTLVGTVEACDLIEPRPTWEDMIDDADIVFIGEVVAIVPAENVDAGDRAVFQVEKAVKGGVEESVEAIMGMNSCNRSFEMGDRVIFAGDVWGNGPALIARDSGWDPTVVLDEPPTPEQLVQLDYLNKLAGGRETSTSEGGTK